MSRSLRIGTRGTPLALRQYEIVVAALKRLSPSLPTTPVLIRAEGDDRTRPAWTTDTPGLFTNALTTALSAGDIDAAVHSLKDLPVQVGPATVLSAILERDDPGDVLVDRLGRSLTLLPPGAVVGTCSLRRRAQLLERRPDLNVVEIRGGVTHRLHQLVQPASPVAAIVLARAGLQRLDRTAVITDTFPPDRWLPAPGQAAIAVEVRAADTWAVAQTAPLDHEITRRAVTSERSVLRALGAGCHAPVGAWARHEAGRWSLSAGVWSHDGTRRLQVERTSAVANEADAEALGEDAAAHLLSHGAAALVDREAKAHVLN